MGHHELVCFTKWQSLETSAAHSLALSSYSSFSLGLTIQAFLCLHLTVCLPLAQRKTGLITPYDQFPLMPLVCSLEIEIWKLGKKLRKNL